MDRIARFRNARYGLFIHWGPYSLRGFEASLPLVDGAASFAEYHALANSFRPQRYDPRAWAALAKAAGMRYAVLTSKHHDGYALFDTQLSAYSAPKTAAGRDLLRPYVEAFRDAGLLVGFYFSLADWHHPDYPAQTVDPRVWSQRPPQCLPPDAPESIAADTARWQRYLDFMFGQVRELLTNYGPIDLLWFDGYWEHTAEEWRSADLVRMIRELQSDVIINDRLADRLLGDYATPEQYVPIASPDRPWETCMTINRTWGYNPADHAYKPAHELIATLSEVAAKGGNFLLNVGPTPDGEIPPEFASRLRVIGHWLERNGEAVFSQGDGLPPGAYPGPTTGDDEAIYLHVLGYPPGGVVGVRGLDRRVIDARLLATGAPLEFEQHGVDPKHGNLRVHLPAVVDSHITIVKLILQR